MSEHCCFAGGLGKAVGGRETAQGGTVISVNVGVAALSVAIWELRQE